MRLPLDAPHSSIRSGSQIINAKTMLYNTQNLPRMLSKVLQAQLRNVSGSLDVDQMIESTAGLNRVGAEMKRIATRWGVHVDFVKIQKVDAGELQQTPLPSYITKVFCLSVHTSCNSCVQGPCLATLRRRRMQT